MVRLLEYRINVTQVYQPNKQGTMCKEFLFKTDAEDTLFSIKNPKFMGISNGEPYYSREEAAIVLDDFINVPNNLRVEYNPTPDEGRPRLYMKSIRTGDMVMVF